MRALVITIRGTKAEPAGSKIRNRFQGVRDDNPKLKPWQAIVRMEAEAAIRAAGGSSHVFALSGEQIPIWPTEALMLDVVEYRVRPPSHFTSKGALSAQGRKFPTHPTAKPDRGKIARGIEDALTGLVYRDDVQIVDGRVAKRWSTSARTVIIVAPVEDQRAMLERFQTFQALALAEEAESLERQEEVAG